MSFSVQFEQLMNNGSLYSNEDDREVPDLVDATMECMDILEELTQLESNLFVYEAVKHVKKAKAGKKKVKTKTTKMKAKDAKAKKAGGKVVKITKEGDTDGQQADGGTGPIPVTSDTNGLTDTDLDADPDAEVQVTEIADDEPAETVAPDTATEAADLVMEGGERFLVIYEDASLAGIVTEAAKDEARFIDKLIALIKKIGDWISSFIAKVASWLKGEEKFYEANKGKFVLDKPCGKAIPDFRQAKWKFLGQTIGGSSPEDVVKQVLKALNNLINRLNGASRNEARSTDAEGIELEQPTGTEQIPSKVGVSEATFKYFVEEFPKTLNDTRKAWRDVESKYRKISSETAPEAKKGIIGAHKAINKSFGAMMKTSRIMLGVMKSCGPTKTKEGEKK